MDGDIHRPVFIVGDEWVTGARFFALVEQVAATLPECPQVINYCEDRFWFAVIFFAAQLRGKTNVLLPGHHPGMLESAVRDFPAACLCAEVEPAASALPFFDADNFSLGVAEASASPRLPANQMAMVVYTSGTTGQAKPLAKSLGCILDGAKINTAIFSDTFGLAADGLIATVPPWHMYGLEWSVFLPFFVNAPAYCGSTLFPGDIAAACHLVGERSVLVTTPHHLRALMHAKTPVDDLCHVITATAPLADELAKAVIGRVNGKLLEIYGCSEAGSVASREPAVADGFRFSPAFHATTNADVTTLRADHIADRVELSDVLEFASSGAFQIVGRSAELIKVAGKRASLAALNELLLAIDFVMDGAFYHSGDDSERLAVVAVIDPAQSHRSAQDIREALSGSIEPAFIPRKIKLVSELPRNPTGKLLQNDLRRIVTATSDSA